MTTRSTPEPPSTGLASLVDAETRWNHEIATARDAAASALAAARHRAETAAAALGADIEHERDRVAAAVDAEIDAQLSATATTRNAEIARFAAIECAVLAHLAHRIAARLAAFATDEAAS